MIHERWKEREDDRESNQVQKEGEKDNFDGGSRMRREFFGCGFFHAEIIVKFLDTFNGLSRTDDDRRVRTQLGSFRLVLKMNTSTRDTSAHNKA